MASKTIGVTGAMGFIGGAICIELKKKGYKVIGLDIKKFDYLLPFMDDFYQCYFEDIPKLQEDWKYCDAIVHCAGTSLVGPSIDNPAIYYTNNVAKTIELINWCALQDKHILFSSSASVYKTKNKKLTEKDDLLPLSPYARSKRMVEEVLEDYTKAYKLKSTVFRYFNACGSLGSTHGQVSGSTHIFPSLFESDRFNLYGTDYKTTDGTCVRDYIHVKDIVDAHIMAIEAKVYGLYNLGCSVGYSNLEIIKAVKKVKSNIEIIEGSRRPGDADVLIADSTKAGSALGWVPTRTLTDIVNDLNLWYKSENFKR